MTRKPVNRTIRRNQYSPERLSIIKVSDLRVFRGGAGTVASYYRRELWLSWIRLAPETDSDISACQFSSDKKDRDVGIICQSKLCKRANGPPIDTLEFAICSHILIRIYIKGPRISWTVTTNLVQLCNAILIYFIRLTFSLPRYKNKIIYYCYNQFCV